MSSLIVRIFDNYGDALAAANELQRSRFGSKAISLISTARNPEPDEPLDTTAALKKTGIPAADLPAFSGVVAEGKSVLAVRAVFGAAVKAIRTMKRHNPIDGGFGWKEYSMTTSNNNNKNENKAKNESAAPLSSALGLPLLLNDAAPFSRFFKWPTLLNNPAPLSSWFKFPTLSKGSGRSEYTFGEPKLIHDEGEASRARRTSGPSEAHRE